MNAEPIAAELSEVVMTYVWSVPGRPWPSRDPEAVRARYGDGAEQLIARLDAVFAVVDAAPLDWDAEDLPTAAARIERLVHDAHPELDAAACHAVANEFAFRWR